MTITLPTVQQTARAAERTARRPATERSTRILLIEDEPLTAEVFALALTRGGYVVEVASDGLQALRRLRERMPSLVVVDICLPTLSGADIVRELRRTGHDTLPIVVVSGSAQQQTNLTGAELRPGVWLGKPIKPRTLLATVRELTQHHDGSLPRD